MIIIILSRAVHLIFQNNFGNNRQQRNWKLFQTIRQAHLNLVLKIITIAIKLK